MIFCPDFIDLLASIASASTVCSSAPTFWSSASICLRRHSELQSFIVSCACAVEWIAETAIAKTDPVAMQASKNFFMAGSALVHLDRTAPGVVQRVCRRKRFRTVPGYSRQPAPAVLIEIGSRSMPFKGISFLPRDLDIMQSGDSWLCE